MSEFDTNFVINSIVYFGECLNIDLLEQTKKGDDEGDDEAKSST